MHFGATQFFIGGDFAGGGFQQRRAGQEHLGALADHYHVVRQAWLIGATGGGVAVYHGDLRNAGSGQPCLVGKSAGAVHEHFCRIVQIGAAGFHQAHHRQLVFHGDALQAQGFMQARGRNGAALDGGIGGSNQATNAGHIADAGNGAAAGFGTVLVIVHLVTGQVHQAQEWRTGVQQAGDTLMGQ